MGIYLSDEELAELARAHPDHDPHACPTCRGTQTYTWKGEAHECPCLDQRRLWAHYSLAGIPLRYQRMTWNDLHLPDVQLAPIRGYLDAVDSYLVNGIGLFLSGGVGVGKTMLATLILKDLVLKGVNCYFTTFSGAVEAFTSTWGDNAEKTRFANRFMRSKVLALDDLGKEFRASNRLPQTTFDHILRTRVFEARPTILTTNLTPAEVQVGYGAPVLSLLAEQSIHVHLSGDDFRPHAHSRSLSEVRAGEVRPIA